MNNPGLSFHAFARVPLLETATPVQRLARLEASLGDALKGCHLYLKRDDHMLLAGGGNKLRKLEFLLGAAVAEGADTIITTGGLQSNHARLTAAAASRLGLECELVLGRAVPRSDLEYEKNGNVLLDKLLGAKLHVMEQGESAADFAVERARLLTAEGRNVFSIPMGGSSSLGALGYVRCAEEIQQHERELGVTFDKVFVPNGSSGTHAGLAAGMRLLGRPAATVRSYAVLDEADASARKTLKLANDALSLMGGSQLQLDDIDVSGGYRGAGYGIPTNEGMAAITLLAQTEGILLDPVYSAKAFAGMLGDIRSGAFATDSNILFVLTGGSPGLYAYRRAFDEPKDLDGTFSR